jgi:hypothetical protein
MRVEMQRVSLQERGKIVKRYEVGSGYFVVFTKVDVVDWRTFRCGVRLLGDPP